MAVLVTGAGGFIGRAVLARLQDQGLETIALLGPDDGPAIAGHRTLRGDIRDRQAVSEALDGARALVHLAGPASVAASFESPALYASAHVTGTAVLFEAARRRGLRCAVVVSSAEIYGQASVARVSEAVRPAPRSPYASAKLVAEAVAARLLPDGLTVVRPFSVYGPGMRSTSLLGRILTQAPAGRIELEALHPIRDYVHVADVAQLIEVALQREGGPRRTLNACSGEGVSVSQLARMLMDVMGGPGPIVEVPPLRPRPAEISYLVGDPGAALHLGWRGTRPLAEGLADVARAWTAEAALR